MKQLLLIAGAAALACTSPALAKPGKGNGHSGNHHARSLGAPVYGGHNCPPGLAKKAVPCVAPGQAKKMFGVGERFRLGYGGINPYGYSSIPYDLRNQYGLDPYGNYYYGQGYLYRVDPATMIVQQVLPAIL